MRALTLKPHWAHAVAWLDKRIENRSRPIPPKLVGKRVAIHAGASHVRGWAHELVVHLDPSSFRTRIDGGGLQQHVAMGSWAHHLPATRAIVATAVLGYSRPAVEHTGIGGPPAWGDPTSAWWWHITSVRRLVEPVAVQRGQLGLWTLDDDTTAAVEAAAWETA